MIRALSRIVTGLYLGAAVTAAPAAVHAAPIWQDGFENYADTTALRAVWDDPAYTGAYLPTLGSTAHMGNKSMSLRWNGEAGVRSLGGSYGAGETVDVTAFIYAEKDATGNMRVQLGDDGNTYNWYSFMVQLHLGSRLQYTNGAAFDIAAEGTPTIEADTWYKLRIVATPTLNGTSTADIYLNDQLIVQGANYVRSTVLTKTIRFSSYSNPTNTSTNHYFIDDVTVSVPEPSALSLGALGLLGLLAARRRTGADA